MIEITKKKQRECSKHGLSARDMALADLVLAGWGKWDAYLAMDLYKPALSDFQNDVIFKKVTENPNFLAYINAKTLEIEKRKEKEKKEKKAAAKAAKEVNLPTDTEISNSPLTKEELLAELKKSADDLKDDPKNRALVLARYADLQKMKQDEVKTEDTTVHYYLPLTCFKCSLYNAEKRRKKNKEE